ncbi:MAG: hypothetical protein ACLFO2_04760 [Candidatus Woesearchaeota archaeon]
MTTQEELETLTKQTLTRLAQDIFQVERPPNPIVKYDPHTEYPNHHEGTITYNTPNPKAIYEETAHYLHEHHKREKTKGLDTLTRFFRRTNEEALGYFSRHFSRQESKDTLADALEHPEPHPFSTSLAKDIHESITTIISAADQKDYATATGPKTRKAIDDYLNPHTRPRAPPEAHMNLALPRELSRHTPTIMATLKDLKTYSKAIHLLGYQLGDDLHTYYEESPDQARKLARKMLTATEKDSIKTVLEASKEIYSRKR